MSNILGRRCFVLILIIIPNYLSSQLFGIVIIKNDMTKKSHTKNIQKAYVMSYNSMLQFRFD